MVMMTKEVVEKMIKYMNKNRHISITQKCKRIGISPQGYYKACRKYDLDGKIGVKKPRFDLKRALKIMAEDDSDTEECNSSQDDSE